MADDLVNALLRRYADADPLGSGNGGYYADPASGVARHPALVNALAQAYAAGNGGRNRLEGDPAWPTLPSLPDNRPSLSAYGRPAPPRWEREVAEGISPTMGAYGLAGLATTAAMDAGHGKYDPETLGPLAAMTFMPGAKRGSLIQRIDAAPKAPMRQALPSDFTVQRGKPIYGEQQWTVHHPSGEDSGVSGRFVPGSALYIESSALRKDQQGEGVGIAMYQPLIDAAHKEGVVVHSDSQVSPEALRIYDALARRGYQVERHPDATLDANGMTIVPNKRGWPERPVFTVRPPQGMTPEMAAILEKYSIIGPAALGAAASVLAPDKSQAMNTTPVQGYPPGSQPIPPIIREQRAIREGVDDPLQTHDMFSGREPEIRELMERRQRALERPYPGYPAFQKPHSQQ